MKKLLLILLCLPLIGVGQFLPIKRSGSDIKQCSDGGFIVAGTSNKDAYLFKTDRYGNRLWVNIFGGSNSDVANSVQICSDGGFIVAGSSGYLWHKYESYRTSNDAYLFKTDRNGNLLWEKKFGGSSSDVANSVQICSDGGFTVAGTSNKDAYLFKTDRNGNLLWEKKFGGSSSYVANSNSVQICSDGGFIVAVKSYNDAYLFKTDRNGNLLWEKKFGGSNSDAANSVQICSDGGFIVAGESNNDAYLFKTDRNGNLLWEKKFDYSDIHTDFSEYINSVQICSDGGYVMIGSHLLRTNEIGEVFEATLTDRITSYVEAKVNIWQEKGEFEKSSDYKIRVTQKSRNKKTDDIQKEALKHFKKEYKKKVSFETVTLNEYDADNETYLLDPWPLKQFVLPVPIEKAPSFKRNYISSKFQNVDFIIKNDEFILSHIEFTVDNEVYTYDIFNNNLYTTTTFDYNFDEVEIDKCIGDCQNGYGTYTAKEGTYKGNWKDGKVHGEGIFEGNEYTYDGKYVNGKQQGQGKKTYTNGTIEKGLFENGVFIGE